MKVAVCTPCHNRPTHRYVQSLGALLTRPGHELRLFLQQRTPVSFNRNLIAQGAMDWGAEALLWIDDDQTFPDDTLERLLAHEKTIVGCNIVIRSTDLFTAARWNGNDWEQVTTTEAKAAAGTLEPVGRLGLGVTLIRREVFESVEPPWFIEGMRRDGSFVGEDCHFFERAKGHTAYVDHALSWQVGHVHERAVFPRDALPNSR